VFSTLFPCICRVALLLETLDGLEIPCRPRRQ
jgi:hypothetical protein